MTKLSQILAKFIMLVFLILDLGLIVVFWHASPYAIWTKFTFLTSLTIILGTLFFLLWRNREIKLKKKVFIICLIGAVLLNLSLLFLPYNYPRGDYATFYNNARSLAAKNTLSLPRYVATFPHLSAYIFLLGGIMKVTFAKYYMVVFLNILFNLGGAWILYQLFKTNKQEDLGKIGALIWLVNPLNLVWTTTCIPIVAFQTCFLLAIYSFLKLLTKHDRWSKVILSSLLCGIVVGIANLFRPIMIIFLIAVVIYYGYLILLKKLTWPKVVISIILIFLPYALIGKANDALLTKVSGYQTSSTPGWNVYVGSVAPNGQWTEALGEEFNTWAMKKNYNVPAFQKAMLDKGLKNYQSYSFGSLMRLMKNKFIVLNHNMTALNADILYGNICHCPSLIRHLVYVLSTLYLAFCLLGSLATFIKNRQHLTDNILVFYALLIIGIELATLLLEVAVRYTIPIYVPLLLLSLNYFQKRED